jgi:DNA-directed RNA polymerase specialized sigma24 family protein
VSPATAVKGCVHRKTESDPYRCSACYAERSSRRKAIKVRRQEEMPFEKYLEVLAPSIRSAVRRQTGKHPFLSEEDLLQECRMKLWKVYRKYLVTARRAKETTGVRRIGGASLKTCLLDVIDKTLVHGQAQASIVSIDARVVNGNPHAVAESVLSDLIADDREVSPAEAAEASEQFERLAASLLETERLVLRELIAMSNRTLELFEDIRRKAPRTRQTDSVRFEAISKSLEVPLKVVMNVVPKLLRGLEGGEQ